MVGYALSAASDESYENILITVFDADDFTFVDDGTESAIYKYSRSLCVAERVDGKLRKEEKIPYEMIYEVADLLKTEERKWQFPMALVWSFPEFGKLELISAEFQNIWPAVMFVSANMECAFLNITDLFFSKGIRPLAASFFCDVLNSLMFKLGIYIPDPFCACFNSVFCDRRIPEAVKTLFGISFFDIHKNTSSLLKASVKYDCIRAKVKTNKKRVLKILEKSLAEKHAEDFPDSGMHREFIEIKRRCVSECLKAVYECMKHKSDVSRMYEKLNLYISDAIKEIVSAADRLLHQYVISVRTDIYYLNFNDLISAFAFADDRMDLKTVIRMTRRKNTVACKNKIPDAVLANGQMLNW